MPFYFTTYGREYALTLENDGLMHAVALGLKAETLDDLKAQVVAYVKNEKSAPRIPVIILDEPWLYARGYVLGLASPIADRNGYRWVSYKDDSSGKTKRRTFSSSFLLPDTEENRQKVSDLVLLGRKISALIDQSKELRSQLISISAIRKDDEDDED